MGPRTCAVTAGRDDRNGICVPRLPRAVPPPISALQREKSAARCGLRKYSNPMGNLKKKRRLKMNKHKRRKRLKSHRHQKRTWQK